MSFDIVNRYTKSVLFTAVAENTKDALIEAVKSGANLRGANLRGANLGGADLGGADLRGANGLLPNGVISLQILGSSHEIIVREVGHITIGCEHHPVDWREVHYRAVGRKESYTEAQVEEYGRYIEWCKEWMERNGVLAVTEVKA